MRFLIYSDPHWCYNSSIVRKAEDKYSMRLNNLIQTMNWVEQTAYDEGCDAIICGGDFFDKETLNSTEISALQEVKWAENISHVYLCGNHELGINTLEYNSANLFKMHKNSVVITEPTQYALSDKTTLCFLPYILESNRKPLGEYFNTDKYTNRICISHNDIKGIQLGGFLSTMGFEVSDIDSTFTHFINGHIHNSAHISSVAFNLGNVTGQNFSEDAYKYEHHIMILDITNDIVTHKIIENPYAFNFYKLDFTSATNEKIVSALMTLNKPNCVLSITCNDNNLVFIKEQLIKYDNIVESRVLCQHEVVVVDGPVEELTQVDHLKEFSKYITETMGTDDTVLSELQEVIG